MDNQQPAWHPEPVQKQRSTNKIMLWFGGLIAASLVFGAGWLVGSDRITVNSAQNLASTIADGSSADITTDGLQELYDQLRTKYDGKIIEQDVLDGLKRGAVAAVGDTYTEYLSDEETTAFNEGLEGSFEGIGAELGKEGNFVIIVAPIKGAPAERAGLRAQDIIVAIDGEEATNITVTEAVQRIRGEKGTDVVLTIVREGGQQDITITRDTIDIPSVEWRVENNVGIIELSRFGSDTVSLTRQAAQEFTALDITKVVLDMRGNPGGLLSGAVGVSDIWLQPGTTILEEKRGDEVIETFTSQNAALFGAVVETIVLIDQGSASASEIVAGALRDSGRATLVGQTSFGKGSVQDLVQLRGGGSLKVTIARWFTPEGKNIDKEGITPDVEVELSIEDIENDRDPQLDRALQLLAE